MRRACVRAFGGGREAWHSANHSRIKNQVTEDQQESLQGRYRSFRLIELKETEDGQAWTSVIVSSPMLLMSSALDVKANLVAGRSQRSLLFRATSFSLQCWLLTTQTCNRCLRRKHNLVGHPHTGGYSNDTRVRTAAAGPKGETLNGLIFFVQ
jgi:hypothetical protein